jgi:hypothetical protein
MQKKTIIPTITRPATAHPTAMPIPEVLVPDVFSLMVSFAVLLAVPLLQLIVGS